MDVRLVEMGRMILVGMGFYGDPFGRASAWDEDNEIGSLWRRFGAYLAAHPDAIADKETDEGVGYELHIRSDETPKTGRYEVFVGVQIRSLDSVPLSLSAKILKAADYAAVTVRGAEMEGDWMEKMYRELVPSLGRVADPDAGFSIERYDERFKGMDKLAESVFEYYIPLSPRGRS
jgi:predicted transcriptional regulator YdeE